jgi:hypothetical protein
MLDGVSIEDLLQRWWSWLLSIPDPINPSNDQTGGRCHVSQPADTYLWLAGAHKDEPYKTMITVNRSCTVSVGRSLGVAIAANECSEAEFPHITSDDGLLKCAINGDTLEHISARWDGRDLSDFIGNNLINIGVSTAIFEVDLPPDNIFGAPPGSTRFAAHGFMVIVADIGEGDHNFTFTQITSPDADSRTEPSGYQVNYNLHFDKPK